MARYKLTTQDRSKGGKSTATKQPPPGYTSHMQFIGEAGNRSFAERWFDGDIDKARQALARIGNYATDPNRWNGAFALPSWFPNELTRQLVERYSYSDDAIPF